jgi:hypothetical protein
VGVDAAGVVGLVAGVAFPASATFAWGGFSVVSGLTCPAAEGLFSVVLVPVFEEATGPAASAEDAVDSGPDKLG